MKNYDQIDNQICRSVRDKILAQKAKYDFLSTYAFNYLQSAMKEKGDLIDYRKIEPKMDVHPSEIGKYKIVLKDGTPLTLEALYEYDAEFVWPNYPITVDTEEEAKTFAMCWRDYIHSHMRAKK